MSKIDVKAYFRAVEGREESEFDKSQARFLWQCIGIIFLGLVVVKILDEIKIKEIIFGN